MVSTRYKFNAHIIILLGNFTNIIIKFGTTRLIICNYTTIIEKKGSFTGNDYIFVGKFSREK